VRGALEEVEVYPRHTRRHENATVPRANRTTGRRGVVTSAGFTRQYARARATRRSALSCCPTAETMRLVEVEAAMC